MDRLNFITPSPFSWPHSLLWCPWLTAPEWQVIHLTDWDHLLFAVEKQKWNCVTRRDFKHSKCNRFFSSQKLQPHFLARTKWNILKNRAVPCAWPLRGNTSFGGKRVRTRSAFKLQTCCCCATMQTAIVLAGSAHAVKSTRVLHVLLCITQLADGLYFPWWRPSVENVWRFFYFLTFFSLVNRNYSWKAFWNLREAFP